MGFLYYCIKERGNQFIKGEKSKGYRYTEKYCTRLKDVEIIKMTLVRSIKKDREVSKIVKTKYDYLYEWFDGKLGVNSSAYDLLDDQFKNTSGNYEALNKYHAVFRNISSIADKDYFVSVDSTVGRFHSNLTNLKKDYRNFLNYDNQELVSVDLKNSQPYLSVVLFSEDFFQSKNEDSNRVTISDLFKESSTSLTTSLHSSSINQPSITYSSSILIPSPSTPLIIPPPMLGEIMEFIDSQDVNKYIQLVVDGIIYEYLQDEIRKYSGESVDRDTAKKVFFSIIFSGNQFTGGYKMLFRDRFPNVYSIFSLLKSKQKNLLSLILQRIESYMILNVICKRIHIERSMMPIFTIHDSIVTTTGNESYVEQIMTEEFSRFIGYEPRLSIEFWRSDNICSDKDMKETYNYTSLSTSIPKFHNEAN